MRIVFCHRRPDRTLKFKGSYLPVCARCTGIYLGAFIAFVLQFFIKFNYDLNMLYISSFLIIPTVLDGTMQLFKLRESTNFIRLTTGFICGVGLVMFDNAIVEIFNK